MAKAKGTKMSLAAFNQQEGDGGYDPLPTAPRQRDPATGSTNGGDDRRSKVDGGNWVRGDKFQSSEDGEQRGGRGRGGYGRNRGGDDENNNGEAASSRADDANQWRSGGRGGGDDRDRRSGGGFGGNRDRRDDRDGDSDTPRRSGGYGRGRDEETKPSEGASSSNDWRRSGPPSDGDRDRFSGGNNRRFEDRDSRYGGGRDRRDDRDGDRSNRRGGDESNDRFRREDRGGDREDRFGGRRDDRFGGDRDNRRGGDDRYGGDRERDGGRYGERRYGGDRDSRYGGRGGDNDDRPAHLRFGRSRNDGGAEGKSDLSAVDDFPLPSSSAANRTEASEKAAAGPKITVKTAKKPAASEEGDKTEGKAESESSVSKKKSNKKVITPLEAALKGGVINDSQFTASMDWLVDEKARLDDAEERRELVYAIAGSLMDKKLSLSTVITALEKSLPDNASTFVLDLIKAIRTRKDESVALALVKGADQSKVLALISNDKQGSALESFLNDNELSILIPVPDLSESVEKALQNKESADAILKIIDNAVDKKAAVSYLLPLVSKYLIALLFADKPKHNISVLTAWAPLLSRVTLHDKLAKVSLLFSICNGWFTETKAAKGVIRELFETLLNNKVIQVESLIDWRDSKEKSQSKPKALLQVSTWISDIEPKREEPEEEEEGEEGDDDELLTNPNQQD